MFVCVCVCVCVWGWVCIYAYLCLFVYCSKSAVLFITITVNLPFLRLNQIISFCSNCSNSRKANEDITF